MFPFRRPSRGSSSLPLPPDYPDNNNSGSIPEVNGVEQTTLLGGNGRISQDSTLPATDVIESVEDMDDDAVGCTSTFQSYCSEWEKLFLKHDYLKYVKKIGSNGGLRSSRFRSIAWKLFLGVLPEDQTLWTSATDDWRRQYDDLKTKLIVNPRNAEAKDLSINNPLSQEVESPWNQFFLDNELRLTIKQDVIRTYPDVPFFAEDRIHNMMIDILFCYGRLRSFVAYRQGMHELLAPLIFVLHCDHQAFLHACEIESVGNLAKDVLNPEYLEHDAYSLFSQIMQIVESWYVSKETLPTLSRSNNDVLAQPFMRPQDFHPSNVIVTKLNYIQDNLLKGEDQELYDHLIKMDIAPQIYGIRWLRLLFGREFPMQDLLILWDAIFADGLTFDLVDYVFVAMLLYLKNALLTSDYPSCLHLLMKYPPISDIRFFVKKALMLRDPPPDVPKLVDYYYKAELGNSVVNGSSSGDFTASLKRGSLKASSSLVQSWSSFTRMSLKRPGSLGLSGSSNNPAMSKSTSEPMNLITDTAISPDRVVVDHRKGSTASLSWIEGSLMQDPRHHSGLKLNPSTQSLVRLESDAMSSSMVEQMSTASSDGGGGNASPRAGKFSFFGTRGRKPTANKAKQAIKNANADKDKEGSATSSYISNIDIACRRCAAELDHHIGTIQKFVLRQNSLAEDDEILLALAGIKQVRDVLKGVLKPSDMFCNPEACSAHPVGNLTSGHLMRKQQPSSTQSSLANTPMFETAAGKFFIATPDLLSSDTDINSPENGDRLLPEPNVVERNPSSDAIVADQNFEVSSKNRYSRDEEVKEKISAKLRRMEMLKSADSSMEIKFQKSLPENVLLGNSEVEMVELQREQDFRSEARKSAYTDQRFHKCPANHQTKYHDDYRVSANAAHEASAGQSHLTDSGQIHNHMEGHPGSPWSTMVHHGLHTGGYIDLDSAGDNSFHDNSEISRLTDKIKNLTSFK